MISFFKSKYYLKDILPENYIDIHNHLLPGIDDGARSILETNELISKMKFLNINQAIATPHTYHGLWNNTPKTIKKSFEIATKSDSNLLFLKGYASEYLLDATLVKRAQEEQLLCLKDSYILIELHLINNPLNLYEMLFELKNKGYKIIIAHPERYLYFHNDMKKFEKLRASGVYFQLNLLSLTGYYGTPIQKKAEKLLQHDLYDFTGTDVHNDNQITTLIKKPILFSNKNKIGDLLRENNLFILNKVPE